MSSKAHGRFAWLFLLSISFDPCIILSIEYRIRLAQLSFARTREEDFFLFLRLKDYKRIDHCGKKSEHTFNSIGIFHLKLYIIGKSSNRLEVAL